MRWNVKRLKGDVEKIYGEKQRRLLSPSIDSLIDRKSFARYHFQESERLLKNFLINKTDRHDLVKLVVGTDQEELNEFSQCLLCVKAHIVACLQSMHAMADILGHVVYYALGMNNDHKTRLNLRDVSIRSVLKKLTAYSEYKALTDKMSQLTSNDDFEYLSHIVNHSKHRSIIGASFTFYDQVDAERSHGLEFLDFTFNGTFHSKRWVDTFLEKEYCRQDPLTIEIGNEINLLVQQ